MRVATSYWDFDRQPITPTDASPRQRATVLSSLHAQKTLSRHWKVFVAYVYEQVFSNLALDRSASHTGSSGVEYVF